MLMRNIFYKELAPGEYQCLITEDESYFKNPEWKLLAMLEPDVTDERALEIANEELPA